MGSWLLLFSDVQDGAILPVLLAEAVKTERANAIATGQPRFKAVWFKRLESQSSESVLPGN
jgi:hypothetical protein